jgi:hypothetical protein
MTAPQNEADDAAINAALAKANECAQFIFEMGGWKFRAVQEVDDGGLDEDEACDLLHDLEFRVLFPRFSDSTREILVTLAHYTGWTACGVNTPLSDLTTAQRTIHERWVADMEIKYVEAKNLLLSRRDELSMLSPLQVEILRRYTEVKFVRA